MNKEFNQCSFTAELSLTGQLYASLVGNGSSIQGK